MVDIRYPIGLMFTILGTLVTIFGFVTMKEPDMYQKSLGVNVNIIMGIIMLAFGLFMLYMVLGKNKKA